MSPDLKGHGRISGEERASELSWGQIGDIGWKAKAWLWEEAECSPLFCVNIQLSVIGFWMFEESVWGTERSSDDRVQVISGFVCHIEDFGFYHEATKGFKKRRKLGTKSQQVKL
jgi:hypothetical protein